MLTRALIQRNQSVAEDRITSTSTALLSTSTKCLCNCFEKFARDSWALLIARFDFGITFVLVLVLRRSRYSYSGLCGVGSCPRFTQMERLKDRVRDKEVFAPFAAFRTHDRNITIRR